MIYSQIGLSNPKRKKLFYWVKKLTSVWFHWWLIMAMRRI